MYKKHLKKIPFLKDLYGYFRNHLKTMTDLLQVKLIHKRYPNVINRIRLKSKKSKITIAFFVTQKQLWGCQSLYNAFLMNKLFDPIVVVFPNNEDAINSKIETTQNNYSYFLDKGMNVIYGYDDEEYITLSEISSDIIFYDQPCPHIPESLMWFEASKYSLICYIPYGYKVAGFYQAHFNMYLQNSCWTVFAESDWHKQQFENYGARNGDNVIVSGLPKLDEYSNSGVICTGDNSKTIIWAPHWSISGKSSIGFSTFEYNYKFFYNCAINYKKINWIFKPHQRLRYYLEDVCFMSRKEIDNYYESWGFLPNGEFADDAEYFSLFRKSDALITDCGSFLAEYLPTKNPILYLKSDNNTAGYNEIGEKLISCYYNAKNNEEIKIFIEDVVVEGKDVMKESRLSNLYLVRPNLDGAGEFIVNYLEHNIINNKIN